MLRNCFQLRLPKVVFGSEIDGQSTAQEGLVTVHTGSLEHFSELLLWVDSRLLANSYISVSCRTGFGR